MRPSRLTLPLLLAAAVTALSACDDGPPWLPGEEAQEVETPHDFGPTAAYSRRLIFLGPGEPLPSTALFDFSALSDSAGVRQGVRGRILVENEWESIVDEGWESEPMREPWRLIPGGPLRIVVDHTGEVAAIAYRGEPSVRLEPEARVAESSPDAGTQFVLRQATLEVEGVAVRGILLDSQLGRAVDPTAVPRTAPAGAAEDTAGAPDDGEADPTAEGGSPATPIARPGAEAFLVNSSGYYAVFARSASGDIAWVSHAGSDDIQRGVGVEPLAWSDGADEAARMPTRWRIGGRDSQLAGEVSAAATDLAPLAELGDVTALGYILVSGWIEDGGVRRDVFGVIRQVR